MNKRLVLLTASALAAIVFWTLLEGLISLYRGGDLHPSVLSVGVSLLRRRPAPVSPPRATESKAENDQGDWIFDRVLASKSELESLIDEFKQSGVALGNSPYEQLRDPKVGLNYMDGDGCLRQKPNLTRYVGYLRSTQYFNFDPVSFFYEDPQQLTPKTKAFLERYALRTAVYTTNAFEERTTLPAVSQPSKVLIAEIGRAHV